MKYTSEYIKYKKKEFVSPIAEKRVVAKVNSLLFYHSPSWGNKDAAGMINSGERFIIDEKISVNGLPQYKVHNSKRYIYYVTSNKAFVYLHSDNVVEAVYYFTASNLNICAATEGVFFSCIFMSVPTSVFPSVTSNTLPDERFLIKKYPFPASSNVQ